MRDRPAEAALLGRLRAGDSSAVADLADQYGSRIYQLAFRYVRNREDAEEVAQDVLVKVFRKIRAFRGDAALSSWIYRITFNTAMSRLRARRHAAAPDSLDETFQDGRRPARQIADWSLLADEGVMRSELKARLIQALADMPSIYRVPVILRDIHGLSTEEAGAVVGVRPQTLKSRLHRGRLFLRDRLSSFADGLSLHRVH